MKILLVEDEVMLSNALSKILKHAGYSCDCVYNGIDAIDYAISNIYDLIILDVMLPKLDGISALYEIRKAKVKSKVIILSAKSEVEDKIIGLDGGADDYVTKPFNSQELLARIRAVTKRDSDLFDNNIYSFHTLKLNTKTFEISNKEKKIALTSKEFKILELLIVNRNQITSIETILLKVWGYDEGDATSVWTYISYLRKKLQKLECNIQIKLIRNIGYILIEGDNHD